MPPKKSYESYDSDSDDDLQSQKQRGGKKQRVEKSSDDYKKRRERNNVAVRKSREASRQKAKDTMEKVSLLREENKALEQKVTILNKELGVLKDLFLTHASVAATTQAAVTTRLVPKKEENECNEKSTLENHLYFVAEGSS